MTTQQIENPAVECPSCTRLRAELEIAQHKAKPEETRANFCHDALGNKCQEIDRMEARAMKAEAEMAEEKRKVDVQNKKLPVDPIIRRNVLGGISMEDDSRADCLAIVLCTYFSKHEDRPENDPEHDDNFHWGDWVIEKANKALDLIGAALTAPSEKGESK